MLWQIFPLKSLVTWNHQGGKKQTKKPTNKPPPKNPTKQKNNQKPKNASLGGNVILALPGEAVVQNKSGKAQSCRLKIFLDILRSMMCAISN